MGVNDLQGKQNVDPNGIQGTFVNVLGQVSPPSLLGGTSTNLTANITGPDLQGSIGDVNLQISNGLGNIVNLTGAVDFRLTTIKASTTEVTADRTIILINRT